MSMGLLFDKTSKKSLLSILQMAFTTPFRKALTAVRLKPTSNPYQPECAGYAGNLQFLAVITDSLTIAVGWHASIKRS